MSLANADHPKPDCCVATCVGHKTKNVGNRCKASRDREQARDSNEARRCRRTVKGLKT